MREGGKEGGRAEGKEGRREGGGLWEGGERKGRGGIIP